MLTNFIVSFNSSLTNELSETFNFGSLNGVRGFFTNPSRADDCFIPFSNSSIEIYSGTGNVNLTLPNMLKDNYILLAYHFYSISCTFTEPYSYVTNCEIVKINRTSQGANSPFSITEFAVLKVLKDGDVTLTTNHTIYQTTTWNAAVSICSNCEQ